jgi:uncharacterized protein (DUF2267 family)
MSTTGVEAFDTTLQKTHVWLNGIMAELGWEDRQKAYLALRATLHALRDRLIPEEAVHLGAQLPMLIRGFYYEGWHPSGKPLKEHREQFLSHLNESFRNDPGVNAEQVSRAVFRVLAGSISSGEIADVKGLLPKDLEALWPQEGG